MRTDTASAIHRQDYAPPAFLVDTIDIGFDLDPAETRVAARTVLHRNPASTSSDLVLHGEEIELIALRMNGKTLSQRQYRREAGQLVIPNAPATVTLEIETVIHPDENTSLMGLYVSNGNFFTQCEAEGFRKITYFPDRPDVMAKYRVMLRADKEQFPVLLSNGNLIEQGDIGDGRHYALWEDPFRKPSYLFALVAGKLVCEEQTLRLQSGREALLQVWVEDGNLDKTSFAMESLVKSIRWDEERFGLSLDLERFMIVATSDFNMGAMENKGLNIFNTKYVLANQATATDLDFANVESVVGHEYFHNWTGNRITCRDWFQLSLKEGLTVFRDQEFSQDLAGDASARAVKRIEDVRLLRTVQFAEDAGPMAHPVRPDSYVEINNFYTVTIYEKGAEVVRMMQTLVGRAGFAKGMALYFERHDGQAVTCDDFAQAIADANPGSALAQHLPQFKRWYSQAGTPVVQAHGHYDAATQRYTLTLSQSCAASPGQPVKAPFVIPVQLGLISATGDELLASRLEVLTESRQEWVFDNIVSEPVPSLLRGFSAPVVLDIADSDAQLLTLLAHDSDAFNRWEAAQRLGVRAALKALAANETSAQVLPASLIEALRDVLRHPHLDAAFKELVLTLPSESYLAEQMEVVDPQRIHAVREAMRLQLANELRDDWAWAYEAHSENGAYRPDPVSSGRRALAGMALGFLCLTAASDNDNAWPARALRAFKDAGNMTDRFNALGALVGAGHPLAASALERFHQLFKNEALVLDKWFALQAGASDRGGDILPKVRQLMLHPDFQMRNPNRARSLIFSYCNANPGAFHRSDASGYVFWAERVLDLDAFNPQVAARLARALDRWRKLAEPYRSAAREAIARVAAKTDLSPDVREVVSRALSE